jgi:hypothetical protein
MKVNLSILLYPHSDKDCTCETFAIPHRPQKDDPGMVFQFSAACMNSLLDLYIRVLADPAFTAEKAEKACGMEQLPLSAANE